jgi:hypothetical protein
MKETRRYIELGLRLGKHADELVDAYWGDEEIGRRIDEEPRREPAVLVEEAAELLADVEGDPWLAAQVRSLWANARKLAGEHMSYAEEGELVYGIEPRWYDEAGFRRSLAMLDEALPGAGDLRPRVRRWYASVEVPAEILEPAVLDIAAELRRLTRETVGLPEGEDFQLELVKDKRWTGYAEYLGGLRTRISVNTDLPLPAAMLVGLTSHEIYGGHHTHHVWQEAELVRGRGELEWTIVLLWSPSAVISEGIASAAPELVAGDGQELAADVLGRLGLAYDAEIGARVARASRDMAGLPANVAMLLHDRGASPEEARDYAATWSLQPEERLDALVARQVASPSPVYQHSYWQGRELVDGYVAGDLRRLRELMTARMVPSDLAG